MKYYYCRVKRGGGYVLEGAITVEGPLAQGVNRGFPSKTKGSGGSDPLLEVWPGAFMLQLYTT